jgi:ubiquinone/menaquinone biosynthesis C-methylase UbiE
MKKIIKWSQLFNAKDFKYNTESKKLKNITAYKLAKIIYPDLNYMKFRKISNFITKNIEINKNSKHLDFGSGNGAFLLFFKNKVKKLYSLELSKNFINFQKKFLYNTQYILTNPYNVNFYKKIQDDYIDTTLSCSVFHYFYTKTYCENILKEMIRTTSKQIFIYDIKNKIKQNTFISTVRKRNKLTKKEYLDKYKFTPQRFYTKSFFINFLKKNYPKLKYKIINLPKEATDSKFGFCLKIEK